MVVCVKILLFLVLFHLFKINRDFRSYTVLSVLLSRATFDVLYKAFINTHSRNLGAWHFEQNFSLFLECHAAVLNSYRYLQST